LNHSVALVVTGALLKHANNGIIMLTYSRKITLLMVGLSIISGLIALGLSGDNVQFITVMIMTYIIQMILVFALGKVKN